jgi:mannosyl-oligosaccharide alpha-1,2-mannosidase
MRVSSLFVPLTALALAGHASALPSKRDTQAQRANAVKEAFQTAWDGYYTYAFPHDQLHPEDNTFDDS